VEVNSGPPMEQNTTDHISKQMKNQERERDRKRERVKGFQSESKPIKARGGSEERN